MKKLAFGFMLGFLAGICAYWFFTEQFKKDDLARARDNVLEGAGKVKDAIQEKIGEIKAEDIKEELARTGAIVREKARKAGEFISGSSADARITTAINTKISQQPGLASSNIHVETNDGLVTLSGVVSSHEQIARVVRLALETEGVHKVVSTLQVKPKP